MRAESLFCYNCGGPVSDEGREFEKAHHKKISASQLQNYLAENSDYKTTQLKRETIENFENQPIARPSGEELFEKPQPLEKAEKASIQEEAKLKSAANLRRRAKSFQKKTVEVVWEEPENAPNKWFPLVAVALILFVVAIFYLAMYLK